MSSYPKIKRETDKDYIEYIKANCCLVGILCAGDTVHHHTKTKGSGGSDFSCVPLCVKHHTEVHSIGTKTFQEKYNLDFQQERIRLLIGYIKEKKRTK